MTLNFVDRGGNAGLTPAEAGAHINDGAIVLYVIEGGTMGGKPSVAINLRLPEGGAVTFETSARLLVIAAKAIEARYSDLLA